MKLCKKDFWLAFCSKWQFAFWNTRSEWETLVRLISEYLTSWRSDLRLNTMSKLNQKTIVGKHVKQAYQFFDFLFASKRLFGVAVLVWRNRFAARMTTGIRSAKT